MHIVFYSTNLGKLQNSIFPKVEFNRFSSSNPLGVSRGGGGELAKPTFKFGALLVFFCIVCNYRICRLGCRMSLSGLRTLRGDSGAAQ